MRCSICKKNLNINETYWVDVNYNRHNCVDCQNIIFKAWIRIG